MAGSKDAQEVKHSGAGDSQSKGAAERVLRASGEQVRVLRRGLAARLWIKVRSALADWV